MRCSRWSGQTYQTGADTFELFAAWAAAILPWALVARFPALWIVWLALVNAAVALYFITFGMWGMLFAPEKLLWLLFGVNTAALVVWEGLAAAGIAWLRERWSVRILATASGALITGLAFQDIVDWHGLEPLGRAALAGLDRGGLLRLPALGEGRLRARRRRAVGHRDHDDLDREAADDADAGALLFIGMLVIGMSAAGGFWLKRVATEEDA